MSYQQVFGGTTIYPSDVSYLAIALNADKALEWPLESNDPANPAARIIDVTASGAYRIALPDATLTGAGQTLLFNNLAASTSSFEVVDAADNVLATIAVGEQWQLYLASTATAAGTWRVFRYGASTATVQPSALAGYGITVTANTLSQSTVVSTFNSTPRTVLATDRAAMLVWTGTGAGTVNLPSTVDVGNNFLVSVRNAGGGDLTIDPAGSETVDSSPTLVLQPGDSTSLTTDGLTWYTLGLGQEAVFAFDYTSITVTGGNYTLAGSELNRIAYEFVGTLTSDVYIIVPSTIQQYWVSNATTGAYTLYLRTASGTPLSVSQGARGIYYCNGGNVVNAETGGISVPVNPADGGTGITSYTTGDLIYASAPTVLSKLSDIAVGNALLSGGVGVPPSWGKIGLTTHVTGTLPVANGGTGAATLTGYVKGSGTSAFTASATIPVGDLSGTLGVAAGGTGVATTPSNGQLLIGDGSGYAVANLTAGAGVNITNASGSVTIAAVGLVNWTEAVSTASPNATVPAVSFTATNAAANVDAVLAAKGTGASLAQVPTGTSAGGNKRGSYAVDWQRSRTLAAQVASGSYSAVAGGALNTSSGNYSNIAGGYSNTVSDVYSGVLGGYGNTVSSSYGAVLGGYSNTVSGLGASVLGGYYNTASGTYSVASGFYASTRGLWAAQHHASNYFTALGDAQSGRYVAQRITTDATVTELTLGNQTPAASTRIVLPNDSTYVFDILVVARRTDVDNESAGYRFTGVIDRNSSALSTAIVGTVTKTVIAEDTAAWDVTVDADTTNGSLRIQVTGEAAKTIRWVAVVNTVEVVG